MGPNPYEAPEVSEGIRPAMVDDSLAFWIMFCIFFPFAWAAYVLAVVVFMIP